jgi:hypothetical protein
MAFPKNSNPHPVEPCSQRQFRKPPGVAKLVTTLSLFGVTLGLASSPVHALTLFSGIYAPANWTQTIEGDGSVNTSGAPASIVLQGADDDAGFQNTDFTITAPASGNVSFNWDYTTTDADGPWFDHFGYLLNGIFTQVTDDGGLDSQSGSTIFSVVMGDVFGFRQSSDDSIEGPAFTTVSSFNAPVPGPLPLLGAGATLGWSRRLRHRLRAASLTPPQA